MAALPPRSWPAFARTTSSAGQLTRTTDTTCEGEIGERGLPCTHPTGDGAQLLKRPSVLLAGKPPRCPPRRIDIPKETAPPAVVEAAEVTAWEAMVARCKRSQVGWHCPLAQHLHPPLCPPSHGSSSAGNTIGFAWRLCLRPLAAACACTQRDYRRAPAAGVQAAAEKRRAEVDRGTKAGKSHDPCAAAPPGSHLAPAAVASMTA
jgi:hypothetical protein